MKHSYGKTRSQDPALDEAARSLSAWMYLTLRAKPEMHEVLWALKTDKLTAKRFPSEEEIQDLVTGGTSGEPSPEIVELFPHVADLIAPYWS